MLISLYVLYEYRTFVSLLFPQFSHFLKTFPIFTIKPRGIQMKDKIKQLLEAI